MQHEEVSSPEMFHTHEILNAAGRVFRSATRDNGDSNNKENVAERAASTSSGI
jgi:hypothetical protein